MAFYIKPWRLGQCGRQPRSVLKNESCVKALRVHFLNNSVMGMDYLQRRLEMKLRGEKPKAVDRQRKKDLKVFYDTQAAGAPQFCENCRGSLASTIQFHPRAHICHIVPKSRVNGCPSVGTHPQNRWFGCKECHDFYDGNFYDTEAIKTMPVLPVLQKRMISVYPAIAAPEQRRVPEYLLNAK